MQIPFEMFPRFNQVRDTGLTVAKEISMSRSQLMKLAMHTVAVKGSEALNAGVDKLVNLGLAKYELSAKMQDSVWKIFDEDPV